MVQAAGHSYRSNNLLKLKTYTLENDGWLPLTPSASAFTSCCTARVVINMRAHRLPYHILIFCPLFLYFLEHCLCILSHNLSLLLAHCLHSLVLEYQQCATVYYIPKFTNCCTASLAITGTAHSVS